MNYEKMAHYPRMTDADILALAQHERIAPRPAAILALAGFVGGTSSGAGYPAARPYTGGDVALIVYQDASGARQIAERTKDKMGAAAARGSGSAVGPPSATTSSTAVSP